MVLRAIFVLLQVHLCLQWCLKNTFSELALSQINQIDWSPDGNFIVTGSGSNRVSVLSAVTSNVVWFTTLANVVTTTKFSKTGKWLGVGTTSDDTIRVYNVPAFTLNASFRAEHGNTETVFELDFNSDDTKLATCGSDGKVNQRVFSTGGFDFKTPIDTSKNVISCKYSSNNKIGLSCTDGQMYLLKWDGTIDEKEPKNLVKDVDFRPGSEKYLYGGCTCDKALYEYDTNADNINNFINPNKDQIWAVSHSLDSTFIATGGKNGHTHIINVTNRGSPSIEAYFKESSNSINSVRVSNDNNFVAVSRVDGVIHIYARNCLTCPVGYYTNLTSCRMCSLDLIGCAACKNSSKCQTCYTGYYLDSNSLCKQCDYSLDGCSTCKSSSVCYTCVQTHYLTGNTCTKCKQTTPECEECMNNGTCIKCSYYTYLTASSTCSACKTAITNCVVCYLQENSTAATGSTLYCRQCTQGYYASLTSCLPCSPNCDQCLASGECIACAQEYKLNGTTCIKCDQYCQACLESGTCLQCVATTFLSSGSCFVCAFPCLTCASAATSCRSCVLGYYYVSGTNTCAKCVGCPICNPISGVCLACPIGQYLQTPANTCAYCLNTTSRCQICTASACLACQRNYYLTGSNTCARSVALTDCAVYQKNSTTVCEHCNFGLYLDPGTGNCLTCLKECSVCDNSNNCTQCHVGYYMVSTNATCLPCTGLCRSCNSSTECLSCGDEYYLSGSSCLKCWDQIPYCNSCLNSTHCLDCYLGYQLASNSLSCTQCVSPCATCDFSGCLSCEEGYFYQTSTCTRCASPCVECTSLAVCKACAPGYALDGSSACVSCSTLFPNCLYCSYTACQTCKQSYMLNSTSSACIECPNNVSNCLTCTNLGTCRSCIVGFYPATNGLSCINCSATMPYCQKCVTGTVCDECQSGFYQSAANQCSKCINGCLICSASGVCDICQTGYVKVTGLCKECSDYVFGCQMCTLGAGCSNCLIGYYRASSTSCPLCRSAIEGCSACNSSTVCVSCDAGYFLNSTNKCQKCSSAPGCGLCASVSSCAQCLSGYFLNSTQCQLCSTAYPNCGVCNTSQCLRCETGSYLNSGACTVCTASYGQACIICNTSRCLQCESGHYLDSNGSCQVCALTGCEICSPDGLTCLSCDNTYYKTGSTCTLCESMDIGCISCNGLNTCLLCKTGYYLEANGTCLLCESKFPACDVCSSSRCSVCESNYFHNSTAVAGDCVLCSQLLPGCSLCINQASCLLCESGYYLDSLQCHSCTVLSQCLMCENNSTCLFCGTGYYLKNGQCLSCSAAITGCFSCVSETLCTTCSGSWTMAVGLCVEVKGVTPQNYSNVRIVSEYVNGTHLKHTLFVNGMGFKKIEQKWQQVTKIELVLPPSNKTTLSIVGVEWGSPSLSSSLVFYTNNPFGEISASSSQSMPMVKFNRRVLLTLDDLNMQVNFNMQKAAISEILPDLDTSDQDLALEYKLNSPEFYRSIIKNERYHYYLFGLTVSALLLFIYFIKVCCVLPMTNDAGEIIPHVLLAKMPAMVIYPTLGGYINYCYGFTYLDLPWLNDFFSSSLSNPSDTAPASYQMFYRNLNMPSTYLLALIVFLALFLPLKLYSVYQGCKKSPIKKLTERENTRYMNSTTQSVSVLDKPFSRLEIFREYLYNIFIAGLTVSSFACIVGMSYNPASVVSGDGAFYILGILIYTVIFIDAIRAFMETKAKFNKLRVVIKSTFMTLLFWSPVPLFAAMALLDSAIMLYEYKLKLKEWVVPKIWLLSQVLCLVSYGALIFLSSMIAGIIVASVCIVAVLAFDAYLQYAEHVEIEKIKDLRERSKEYTENNLSIEGFVPDRKQIMDSRANDLYFQDSEQSKKKAEGKDIYQRASVRDSKDKTKSSFNSTAQASSMNLSRMTGLSGEKEARNTFTIKGLGK